MSLSAKRAQPYNKIGVTREQVAPRLVDYGQYASLPRFKVPVALEHRSGCAGAFSRFA